MRAKQTAGFICCVVAGVFFLVAVSIIWRHLQQGAPIEEAVPYAVGAMLWPLGFLIAGLLLLRKKGDQPGGRRPSQRDFEDDYPRRRRRADYDDDDQPRRRSHHDDEPPDERIRG